MKLNFKGKFAPRGKKKITVLIAAVLAVILVVSLVLGMGGGGEPVNVYSFDYLGMTEFWGDSQESYGPVTTDKIQTIFLSDTQTVTEIFVKEGDTVKKGDKLLSFDTTLDSLALERKRLETEKISLQIKELDSQLWELNQKTPVEEMPGYGIPPETTEPDLGAELVKAYQISTDSDYDGSTEETALICWLRDASDINNTILDALWQKAQEFQQKNADKQPSSASANPAEEIITVIVDAIDPVVEVVTPTLPLETLAPTEAETEETTIPSEPEETTKPSEPEETTKPSEPEETTKPSEPEETTKPSEPEETTKPSEPEETTKPSEPEETTKPSEPEETTKPTEPVSQFYVVFKVTEDNLALGARLTWQGMQVFRQENGGYSFKFFDAGAVEDHTIVREEEEAVPEPDYDFAINYTAQELAQMRAELKKQRKELEFNLKMAEAEYKIMQRELSDGNIYAEVDGDVVSLLPEEEARAAMQPFIKVSGGGGFYVEGSVSELEKDNLKPGQEVTINDWNTGMTYTGEVQSIGDFPSGDDGWNGMGNPNATYYPFQVFVDGSADLQEGRYVSVTYSAASAENGIYLNNPFVRTEQGKSYVYLRGEDGKLEKRYVTVGKSLWGSYTQILEGVTAEDWLAFPYGKNLKDGAPAVEADISDLYSY